ncbi:MAG: methyltransferase domain-containing protein [Rhodospirillales bacterium]|nr:methyltransferase domain-containing protein [Rhodospirillales bacterium]
MSDVPVIFDRRSVRRHRDRAATTLAEHDFLFREVAERLADRLDDVKRTFPLALDLGCHGGILAETLAGRGGIKTLIQSDLSEGMARRAGNLAVAADEEALPFAEGRFDLVMSCLSLHWVNDLPGTLLQIRRILKPDGLFLAALFGGGTLKELRASLTDAELAIESGAGVRISPFADVRDAGALLQRAGFALPVVDSDDITVSYSDALRLMADLRGMGESNAVAMRRKSFTRRATMMEAVRLYHERFASTAGETTGRIPATFQVLHMTAWSPDPSQQQPMKPGSGEIDLSEALE